MKEKKMKFVEVISPVKDIRGKILNTTHEVVVRCNGVSESHFAFSEEEAKEIVKNFDKYTHVITGYTYQGYPILVFASSLEEAKTKIKAMYDVAEYVIHSL